MISISAALFIRGKHDMIIAQKSIVVLQHLAYNGNHKMLKKMETSYPPQPPIAINLRTWAWW